MIQCRTFQPLESERSLEYLFISSTPSIFAAPNKLPFSQGTTVPVRRRSRSRSRRPAREPVSKNNHRNTEMESHEL